MGITWSSGTNSRLPFGVNVNLNLFNFEKNEKKNKTTSLYRLNHRFFSFCISLKPLQAFIARNIQKLIHKKADEIVRNMDINTD